jgi:hypothetical protein
MPLGILLQPAPGLENGHVLADAGDYVLQYPPLGDVVEHIVDGHHRHPGLRRQHLEPIEPRPVITLEHAVRRHPQAVACQPFQIKKRFARFVPVRLVGVEDKKLAFGEGLKVGKVQRADTLFRSLAIDLARIADG